MNAIKNTPCLQKYNQYNKIRGGKKSHMMQNLGNLQLHA